jgi:hypothetical protein
MDYHDLNEWVVLSKSALDLFKSAVPLLPKGRQKDELEEKIKQAANLLARSDAKLARELGYHLCECTFPPQIMLWREATKSYDCLNTACNRKISVRDFDPTPRGGSWMAS